MAIVVGKKNSAIAVAAVVVVVVVVIIGDNSNQVRICSKFLSFRSGPMARILIKAQKFLPICVTISVSVPGFLRQEVCELHP